MTVDATEHADGGQRPEPLTVRVSVDGAQRLIDAWKDGRLERALGFSVAALQVLTPFAPTPPADGQGSAPPPESDPGPPLPGSSPAPAAPRVTAPPSASPAQRRSKRWWLVVIVAIVLALLWMTQTFIINDDVEQRPASAGGRPSGVEAAEVESGAAPSAATSTAGEHGLPDEPASTEAPSLTTEPAAEPTPVEQASTGDPTASEAASAEAPVPGPKAHARKGRAPKPKAVTPKDDDAGKLFARYHCQTEGAAFAIVVHARNRSEARASACGGASDGGACIAATTCVEKR